jgi:hypothetical protein
MRAINIYIFIASLLFSCEVEDPVREDTPELVTEVQLKFVTSTGESVTAVARDPDGEGVADLEVITPISLNAETQYNLSISLINALAEPLDPAYNLTEEVSEEADEHLFLFAWTGVIFASPQGDGNIDAREHPLGYNDHDSNGLPVGLETGWHTGAAASGTFRVVLKHQPDVKSEVSGFEQGETDLDITFPVQIQ